jgi:flavin-dependent dehydrogenase
VGAAGLVVVGGGPAGCAAAAAACAEGVDVVLYTAGPSPRMRPVESLPPGTAELVEEIFGADAFRPDDHLPAYANRSRWGSDDLETADFVFNPFGHGWHVRS